MATLANSLLFDIGEPAYAVDDSGAIIAWNKGAEAEFGYPEQQALGRYCWELLCGEDVFGNRYCCERCPHREMARQGQAIKPGRIRLRAANGQLGDYTVRTLVLNGRSGEQVLIHLCRPEPASLSPGMPALTHRAGQRKLLTPRESQVLECLAEGLSTQQTARTLAVSVATVRNHVEHILAKLGVHSRLEAVATARRWGLL